MKLSNFFKTSVKIFSFCEKFGKSCLLIWLIWNIAIWRIFQIILGLGMQISNSILRIREYPWHPWWQVHLSSFFDNFRYETFKYHRKFRWNSSKVSLKREEFGKNLYTYGLTNFPRCFPVFFREISMTHTGEFVFD